MAQKEKELSILVIEDNEMFRKLAVDMLSGYKTYAAANAEQGVVKFKHHRPDITFIDIALPDGTGHDVLNAIKAIDPHAFMVMLTASNLQKDVQDALKNGARGYIVKPFSRQKIKECIEKYHLLAEKLKRRKVTG